MTINIQSLYFPVSQDPFIFFNINLESMQGFKGSFSTASFYFKSSQFIGIKNFHIILIIFFVCLDINCIENVLFSLLFGKNFWMLRFWLFLAGNIHRSSSSLLLNIGPLLPCFLPSLVILSCCLCHLSQVYRLYFGVLKLYIIWKSFHFYLCAFEYTFEIFHRYG